MAKLSQQARIHAIGLAHHAHGAGKVTRLARVHTAEANLGDLERFSQPAIIAAARLEDDPDLLLGAGGGKGFDGRRTIVDPPGTVSGMVDIEPILGNVNADKDLLHYDPCSCPAGSAIAVPINCSG